MSKTGDSPKSGPLVGEGRRRASLPVRGRTAELAVVDETIAAVANGHGGILVIEGPPGIGKSRLVSEFAARAQSSGVRTLFGQAFEHQQSVPFYALFSATLHADPPSVTPKLCAN